MGFIFSAENENGTGNEISFLAGNKNEYCWAFSAENSNEDKTK